MGGSTYLSHLLISNMLLEYTLYKVLVVMLVFIIMWEWLTRSITCFPAKYKSLLQISHTWPIFSKTSQARAAIVVLERRVSDHSVISRPLLFYLSFWEVSTGFILSLLLRDLDRFYFISPFWEISTDFILSLLLRDLDRFYFISPFERSRPILFYLSFWEI